VLLFCVDEMRADHMGPAGNGIVRTPNLERIAARGTVFERAYCNNPICMPARATMFTGMLPRDHGLVINGQTLRRDVPTLPGILAEAGYRSHAAGKLHLTPWVPKTWPADPARYPECIEYWQRGAVSRFPDSYYGFQTVHFVGGHTAYAYGEYLDWVKERGGDPALLCPEQALPSEVSAPGCYHMAMPEELHYNRFIADSTIQLIEESAQEEAAPFFGWCSFPDPHAPVAPPAPYCTMYDPAEIPLPVWREGEIADLPSVYKDVREGTIQPNGSSSEILPEQQYRELIALTYGMITHLDAEIGRVLDALERTGQMENTVIALVADHGDMMGDHHLMWKAFYTFAGCIRIPFILAAPGGVGGQRSAALVSQIDLLPTVLDLCGVENPAHSVGETPFPRGQVRPLRLLPGRSAAGILAGAEERLHEEIVIENDDPSTGLRPRALVTDRWRLTIYPETGEGELFDLQADPQECRNLYELAEYARVRAELTERLLRAYCSQAPLSPMPPWNS
jgi:arylsulfatase A-like enzyme